VVRGLFGVLGVIAVACGGKTEEAAPPAGQSYAEAVRILCGGEAIPDWSALPPAERAGEASRWLDQKITNPEGRALLGALAESDDRAGHVIAAADRIGMARCMPPAVFTRSSVIAGARVPELAGAEAATDELDQDRMLLAITRNEVVVEGKPVVPITGGAIAAGDAMKLMTYLDAARQAGGRAPGATVVAADRELTLAVLLPVMDAIRVAGGRTIELVVAAGPRGEARVIPLRMPKARVGGMPGTTVFLEQGTVLLTSGISARAVSVPLHAPIAQLHAELAALMQGPGRTGAGSEVTVILGETAGAVTVEDFAKVLAALRATPDGTVLFADLVLAKPPPPPVAIPAPAPTPTAAPADPPDDPAAPAGSVTVDPAPAVPQQILQIVHKAYIAGLKRCFDQALKRDPSASGNYELVFTVGADGRVTTATAVFHGTGGGSPQLRACFVSRMQAWRFPATGAVAEYRIPLVLQAQ
jgi:hypothetical protein